MIAISIPKAWLEIAYTDERPSEYQSVLGVPGVGEVIASALLVNESVSHVLMLKEEADLDAVQPSDVLAKFERADALRGEATTPGD